VPRGFRSRRPAGPGPGDANRGSPLPYMAGFRIGRPAVAESSSTPSGGCTGSRNWQPGAKAPAGRRYRVRNGTPTSSLARLRARQQGHPIARPPGGLQSLGCGGKSPSGQPTTWQARPPREPRRERALRPNRGRCRSVPARDSGATALGVGEVAIAQPGPRSVNGSRTNRRPKNTTTPPRPRQGP